MRFDNFALLFCNGDPPSEKRLKSLIPYPSFVACADGGAEKARVSGYEPDVIVGDLDSLGRDRDTRNGSGKLFSKAEIIKISSQDNTDFEKTLDILIKRDLSRFLVVSFSGGRIDQTLANLQIAYEYSRKCELVIADENYVIFPANKDFELNVLRGMEISMIPMEDDTSVSTDGLEYALHDGHLRKGGQGISNRAVKDKIAITIHHGGLLVFLKDA
jgi:thiamine pyrophosphokinase